MRRYIEVYMDRPYRGSYLRLINENYHRHIHIEGDYLYYTMPPTYNEVVSILEYFGDGYSKVDAELKLFLYPDDLRHFIAKYVTWRQIPLMRYDRTDIKTRFKCSITEDEAVLEVDTRYNAKGVRNMDVVGSKEHLLITRESIEGWYTIRYSAVGYNTLISTNVGYMLGETIRNIFSALLEKPMNQKEVDEIAFFLSELDPATSRGYNLDWISVETYFPRKLGWREAVAIPVENALKLKKSVYLYPGNIDYRVGRLDSERRGCRYYLYAIYLVDKVIVREKDGDLRITKEDRIITSGFTITFLVTGCRSRCERQLLNLYPELFGGDENEG